MTVATERVAEVVALVQRCVAWSRSRPDVRALAVVGSWAYGTPRSSSDVDVVLLTTDPAAYLASDGWAQDLDIGRSVRTEDWGAVTERRFRLASGLEVEVNIGTPGWAGVDPVDEGTRRVVTDGLGILHDPHLLLATLAEACGVSGRPRGPLASGSA